MFADELAQNLFYQVFRLMKKLTKNPNRVEFRVINCELFWSEPNIY